MGGGLLDGWRCGIADLTHPSTLGRENSACHLALMSTCRSLSLIKGYCDGDGEPRAGGRREEGRKGGK